MQVNPVENANSLECIRCGLCKKACPSHAISSTLMRKDESETDDEGVVLQAGK